MCSNCRKWIKCHLFPSTDLQQNLVCHKRQCCEREHITSTDEIVEGTRETERQWQIKKKEKLQLSEWVSKWMSKWTKEKEGREIGRWWEFGLPKALHNDTHLKSRTHCLTQWTLLTRPQWYHTNTACISQAECLYLKLHSVYHAGVNKKRASRLFFH